MIKTSRFKHLLLAAVFTTLAAALGGCQTPPPQESTVPAAEAGWQQMYSRLASLQHFKMEGRIGIITPAQRGSARFQLEGLGSGYILTLNSPFGTSLVVITATENLTRVAMDDKTYDNERAEALFAALAGVKVPALTLRNILLGMPEGTVQTDASGRITGSEFAQYQISYAQSRDFDGYALPSQLQIKGPDTEVRVRTDSFTL